MSERGTPQDIWQIKFEEKFNLLQTCQSQKGTQSCFKCTEILECILRKDYVKAVYESMNRGENGDFEF